MNCEDSAAGPLGGQEDSFPVPRSTLKSNVRTLTDTTVIGCQVRVAWHALTTRGTQPACPEAIQKAALSRPRERVAAQPPGEVL
jgi:hypothetical protein